MTDLEKISQETNQNSEIQEKKENWRSYPTKEEKRISRKEKTQTTFMEILLFIINLPFLVLVLPVISLGFFFEKGFEVSHVTFKAIVFRILFILNILFIVGGIMLFVSMKN